MNARLEGRRGSLDVTKEAGGHEAFVRSRIFSECFG